MGAERAAVFWPAPTVLGPGQKGPLVCTGPRGCPCSSAASRVPQGHGGHHRWVCGVMVRSRGWEPKGVRGLEVAGGGAQPAHWRARHCCCPAAIQKICNPRLWETKAVRGFDQGHIQAVAEAGSGGSFPWAYPCEHPPQPVRRVGMLPACSPRTPTQPLPAQTAGHPLEACLWHFSTGPSQALARMREEGASSCPRDSSPPPTPDPLPRLSSALTGVSVLGLGCSGCGGAQRAAHPSGEPGTELSASLLQPRASLRGQAEGERGKQEAEPQCSNIPAVPPAASIIHKQPSVPSLGTMSPLPRLAHSSLAAPLRRWLSSPRRAGKVFSTMADENGFTIQFYPSTSSVILMELLWMGASLSQRTAVAAS